MQTTEKIVVSYCNNILGLATIPNIKCDRGQNEIDILAINPKRLSKKGRFHIECSVHITSHFSRITSAEFSEEKLKMRVEKPKQRMTLGFFIQKKFDAEGVLEKLEQFGFEAGNYQKVIVADGWTADVEILAKEKSILLWDFNQILIELADNCGDTKYYDDDTMRTIQLFLRAQKKHEKQGIRAKEV